MNVLDMVQFSIKGFQPEGEESSVRMWRTPTGERVALYYFAIPPDIQADLRDQQALYTFYEKHAVGAGLGVVEVNSVKLSDVLAVRAIFRQPQEPHGLSYIGSITLPYDDLSYVIKSQCYETGVTGIRVAVIAADYMRTAGVAACVSNMNGVLEMAEREEYDSRFPEDPLSRLRVIMKEAQTTIRLDSALRKHKQFRWKPCS